MSLFQRTRRILQKSYALATEPNKEYKEVGVNLRKKPAYYRLERVYSKQIDQDRHFDSDCLDMPLRPQSQRITNFDWKKITCYNRPKGYIPIKSKQDIRNHQPYIIKRYFAKSTESSGRRGSGKETGRRESERDNESRLSDDRNLTRLDRLNKIAEEKGLRRRRRPTPPETQKK